MSMRKGLLALAALALAMMGLASSAMAADGVVRDASTNSIIPENREIHLAGWAKFDSGSGNYECHVSSVLKVEGKTGTVGRVTSFAPKTANCVGSGLLSGCTLTADSNNTEGTGAHPWRVTATAPGGTIPAGDFDVTPENSTEKIEIKNTFGGFCFASGQSITLKFSSITLTPLKTGTRTVTNTAGHLGETATAAEPKIAGVEISGEGTVEGGFGGTVTATGELEVASADICTWKIASS